MHNPQHISPEPAGKSPQQSDARQEQTDPQLTELKGFTDPSEDLEPTLTDGTKAPEKAQSERQADDSIR